MSRTVVTKGMRNMDLYPLVVVCHYIYRPLLSLLKYYRDTNAAMPCTQEDRQRDREARQICHSYRWSVSLEGKMQSSTHAISTHVRR